MRTIVVVVALAALLGIGFLYSGVYNVAATDPHSAFVAWALSTASHKSVERRAQSIAVPERIEANARIYEEMCAQCHSRPGEAPTELAKGLNPRPPDLAKSAQHLSAAEIFWIAKNGIKMTGMPAWGPTHSDQEIWSVVALVQKLPEMTGDEYQRLTAAAKSEAASSH